MGEWGESGDLDSDFARKRTDTLGLTDTLSDTFIQKLNLETQENAQQVVVQDYSHTYTTRLHNAGRLPEIHVHSPSIQKKFTSKLLHLVGSVQSCGRLSDRVLNYA